MFKSKRRAIVTPQSEHLKLVGTLAMLWGNDEFDFPPIERNSMIAGMGLHDRGYGYLDNSPIGGMTAEEWLPIARRGFFMPCSDVVADTIVKYHFRRLAAHDPSPKRQALAAEFSQAIDEQLKKHGLSKTLFDRMDRITDLCDGFPSAFVSMSPPREKCPFSRAMTKIPRSLSATMWRMARSRSRPGHFQWMNIKGIWSPIKWMDIPNGSTLSSCLIC